MAGFINRGIGSSISNNKVVLKKDLAKIKFSGKSYNSEQMPSLNSVVSIPQNSWSRLGSNIRGDGTTDFSVNREVCRKYALEDDIDMILDIICDEAISSTEQNRDFAYIESSLDIGDKKRELLNSYFNKVRYILGLLTTDDVWKLLRRLLIDGKLAYRIIYDESQKNIVDIIELDPANVQVITDENNKVFYKVKTDIQSNYGLPTSTEILLQEQEIIRIDYSDDDNSMSYVSRLVRSFNTLRIMESTRIIFAVVNSSLKMQYIVPVGSVSSTKGQQRLAQVAADQAEQVDFNWETGEIKTNGHPMLPFYKQMFFGVQDGNRPEVSILNNGGGPDLSNMTAVQYFRDKFNDITKIPSSRLKKDGGATYSMNVEGIQAEEVRFSRFISRIRNVFQMLFIKPVYIQMCLDNDIKDDISFLASLHLVYQSSSVFLQEKKLLLAQQNASAISNILQSIQVQDAEGNQAPYFDIDFLVETFSLFTPEELKKNEEYKKKKKKENEEQAASEQPDVSGTGGMPEEQAGSEQPDVSETGGVSEEQPVEQSTSEGGEQ